MSTDERRVRILLVDAINSLLKGDLGAYIQLREALKEAEALEEAQNDGRIQDLHPVEDQTG